MTKLCILFILCTCIITLFGYYSQSRLNPSHRGRPRGSRNKPKQDIVKMAMEATIDAPTAAENGEISNQPKSGEGTTTDNKGVTITIIH